MARNRRDAKLDRAARRPLAACVVVMLLAATIAALTTDAGRPGRQLTAGEAPVEQPSQTPTTNGDGAVEAVGSAPSDAGSPRSTMTSQPTSTTQQPDATTTSIATSTGSVPAAPPSQANAVSFLVNPAHTGNQDVSLGDHLAKKWTVNLGGRVSYPLIVSPMIYVTVGDGDLMSPTGPSGAHLVALDSATGGVAWGPIELGDTSGNFGATAYEAGDVYAVNGDGLIRAFDARTGALNWTTDLHAPVSAPPTASGGLVYIATNNGSLVAVNEKGGAIQWTGSITRGEDSSPAVTSDGVYVTYNCGSADDLDPVDGRTIWHTGPSDCTGQGGTAPVVFNNQLYARVFKNVYTLNRQYDIQRVLDARTGATVRNFNSFAPPAFSPASQQGFFLPIYDATLGAKPEGRDAGTNAVQWTYGGDYSFASNPVVAGGAVFYSMDTGFLFEFDAKTGKERWHTVSDDLLNENMPDQTAYGLAYCALSVGAGLVVMPADAHLAAFG